MVSSKRVAGFVALVAALAIAFVASARDAVGAEAEQYPLLTARTVDTDAAYYDLGSNTPAVTDDTVATAPVWVLVHGVNADGSLDMVEGQRSIFDVRPGDEGYSDLWQVAAVTVPEDYEPNSIRSRREIEASGYPVEMLEMLVNCPFVPEGATLEGGQPVVAGWVDGEVVHYVDFGPAPKTIAEAWILIGDGDDDSALSGSDVEFDSLPGDDGYSPFRRLNVVRVPDGQRVGSLEDAFVAGLLPASTGVIRNMPVVSSEHADPPASRPYEAPGGGRGIPPVLRAGVYTLLALGAFAIAAALFLSRNRANRQRPA